METKVIKNMLLFFNSKFLLKNNPSLYLKMVKYIYSVEYDSKKIRDFIYSCYREDKEFLGTYIEWLEKNKIKTFTKNLQ
jgi:hypothetical protein